ncbi:MAG: cofactor-independent phosphoglycerate mutase [Omnitrophica bacterium RIFCSPLOWO2_01_FULL_45_10]|nr:MAG: cofactor-independent phosphoglycerate mutase [Omnitrophica bacterium RIFCSPLOWO2_01_FULL_45_10]
MKYAILVGDGMSDYPIKELEGKTPLEVAKIPNLNEIVKRGRIGLVKTVPTGMKPASDIANLSILGYDPKKYYTGRGPLEAANVGIELAEDEVAFRCNLVTINNDIMADYSAGHISEKEAKILIESLNGKLGSDRIRFYHGKSYRNLMIVKAKSREEVGELMKIACTPPHDISEQSISKSRPEGAGSEKLMELMTRSKELLEKHEINKVRLDLKENPANMIWLWGQGTNPNMPSFKGLFGLEGAVISAVDLVNGIGKLIGLELIKVPGATGYYDTNYRGKGEYAVNALKEKDFLFVHVEAPDEAGHNGDMRAKITAIENFDKFVVGAVWRHLKETKEYRLMVLSDHATPVSVRTHVKDPAPFVMAGSGLEHNGFEAFNEANAASSKVKFKSGAALTEAFIKG